MKPFVITIIVTLGLIWGINTAVDELDPYCATPTAEAPPKSADKPEPQKPRDEDWEHHDAVQKEPNHDPPRVTKPERGVTSWLQGDSEYDHALDMQQKLRKPILIDFSPSWCGPCQLLARNFFSRTDVMMRIDKDYVPLRVGQGPLSRKFGIKRYPAIAVVNLDGTYRTFFPTESNFWDELEGATK